MVADAIEENGGYVDKFIGDAVMAVWGAPVEVDNPETRAARAAVQAIEGLNDTNARLPKPGLPPVDMRIGLNAGTIIAGNMGSEKRLNYTIVGDAVNLAARLEPACKVYSIKIMAGEDLAVKLDDSIVSRCVDYVAVKGKSLPVRVYEIAGLTRTFPQDRLEVFREFQKGLEAFWDRRFQEALAIFESLKDHDTVAEMYVGRTQRFIEEPPPEDWDGSVAFMTK
jgi:adenylate cyclase